MFEVLGARPMLERVRQRLRAAGVRGLPLGSILLVDACRKVAHAGAVLAVAGIVVDAKDAAAEAFYRHFGFVPLPGRPDPRSAAGPFWGFQSLATN